MIMLKQVKEYRRYIAEHISNVNRVWDKFRENIVDDFDDAVINQLIKKHDRSKRSLEEFTGYRQWFFPDDGENKSLSMFQKAWNHHQKNNPHHWEYWVLINGKDKEDEVLEMPFVYIVEMLIDWSAMSLKFNDLPSQFYEKNKPKMRLHDDTILAIEHWIGVCDMVIKNIIEGRGEPVNANER